jgi:peptidoglycan/LPS O-acetylase OafA/YrhL
MTKVDSPDKVEALQTQTIKPDAYRLFGAFRFFLALGVVLSHSWGFSVAADQYFFLREIGIGNVAVVGFFVLSGYVISEAVTLFYAGRPFRFLGNRAMRLLPPYLTALAISVAVHWLLQRKGILTLLDYPVPPEGMFDRTNLLGNVTGIIPIFNFQRVLHYPREYYYFVRFSWAVMVESVYYVSVFILMIAVEGVPRLLRRWDDRTKRLAGIAIPSSAVAFVVATHVLNEYGRSVYGVLAFVPYFLLGSMIYYWTMKGRRIFGFGAGISLALIALHFSRYTQGQIPLGHRWLDHLADPIVLAPTLATLLLPAVMIGLASVRVTARLRRLDRWLGDLSYPVYLNQYAVLIVFASLWKGVSIWKQVLAVLAVCGVAYLAKRIVETPMKGIRDRLRGAVLM